MKNDKKNRHKMSVRERNNGAEDDSGPTQRDFEASGISGLATDLHSFGTCPEVAKYIHAAREVIKNRPVIERHSPVGWKDLVHENPSICQQLEIHEFPTEGASEMGGGFCISGGPDPFGARKRMLEALEENRIVDALAAAYEAGYGDGYIFRAREPRAYGEKRATKPTNAQIAVTMVAEEHQSQLSVERALMKIGVSQGEARRLAREAGSIRAFPRKKRDGRSGG